MRNYPRIFAGFSSRRQKFRRRGRFFSPHRYCNINLLFLQRIIRICDDFTPSTCLYLLLVPVLVNDFSRQKTIFNLYVKSPGFVGLIILRRRYRRRDCRLRCHFRRQRYRRGGRRQIRRIRRIFRYTLCRIFRTFFRRCKAYRKLWKEI